MNRRVLHGTASQACFPGVYFMDLHNTICKDLDEDQKEAVNAPEGPLLVVAGPGTGKTLTIVKRIARLVAQGTNPGHIAAVTFTNRAANEMRERLRALLGEGSRALFIGTLHLLGLRILRDHLAGGFAVYNREEQLDLIKKLTADSDMKPQEALDGVSRIKSLVDDAGEGIRDIYDAYQKALSERGALDFDDLIIKPVEFFYDDSILKRYRDRFRHIIVDEYQDINPAQYRFLKLLAGDGGNICAVGDSDQAIYAFRGADIESFLGFERDFSHAKRVALRHNYRSTGTIIGASNSMITHNARRIEKELRPTGETGERISVVSVPDEKAEGNLIVDEIEARIGGTSHYRFLNPAFERGRSDASYGFSDFAVVFRTNAQARLIEEAFIESGIPYQVIGKGRTSKKTEINNIISRLRGCGETGGTLLQEIRQELDAMGLGFLDMGGCERTTEDMINELNLLTPADVFDPRADAVTLMTLHMAKGLEFRVVFMVGMEDGLMPYTIGKDRMDIEEERRLFYVGMTRAKEALFLIHARSRFLYGQRIAPSPSPFIGEIPEAYLDRRFVADRAKKRREDKQMKLF